MAQYAVIGIGKFGESVARSLSTMGHEVLVIDKSEELIQDVADHVTEAIKADAKNEEVLRSVDIAGYDAVIVGMAQNIEANILVAMLLKDLGVKFIVAKAQNKLHGEVLEKIGVDKVIYPEWDMGSRVARSITSSRNILDYIELSPHHSIIEFTALKDYIGKSLAELDLRAKKNISVLAVKKGDRVVVGPGGDVLIEEDDVLVAIGPHDVLRSLSESER